MATVSRTSATVATAGAVVLAAVIALAPGSAAALETGPCEIEVLVEGRPLAEHAARGTTYIEAQKNNEYSIRLSNRSPRRLAVALAIDGLNSIDARTSDARSASKWVLGPWQSITIDGWQVSADNARRFVFTTEAESYGEWLGRTDNLGVIEAVVFRERAPRGFYGYPAEEDSTARRREPSAPGPSTKSEAGEASGAAADGLAATGIGRKVDHRVRRVSLDLEPEPAARLRIRYEYREQLVRLGVLPSPEEQQALDRREQAHGFSDFSFAPDPFAPGRR